MKDLYLPPLNLETAKDRERFSKKLRGELPSYNGTASYRLFISKAVNPNFYSKGQGGSMRREALLLSASMGDGVWRRSVSVKGQKTTSAIPKSPAESGPGCA